MRARSLGCQNIIISPGTSLFDRGPDLGAAAKACSKSKVRLLAEVDIRRFPVDHREVADRPDNFRFRREGRPGPVDPRKPAPPIGEALARLRDATVAERLADTIVQAFQALVREGVGGFRLIGSDRLHRDLIAAIAERLGDKVLLLADATPTTRLISELDYIVASHSPYEIAGSVLAQRPPILFEADDPAIGDPGAAATLKLAVTLGAGVIVPAGHGDEEIAAAMAMPPLSAGGSVRQVSKPGARVFAALRVDGADPRYADEALLILANRTGTLCELPAPELLSRVAAPFLRSSDEPPLGAHEVRAVAVRRAPPVAWPKKMKPTASPGSPRHVVEDVSPSVDDGSYPVKRVIGDRVDVEATVFGDGHEQLAAELRWRAIDEKGWQATRMEQLANDRWRASFALERLGRHEFVVEGWLDRFGGFQRDFRKKVDAKVAQPIDQMEGRALVEQAAGRSKGRLAAALKQHLAALDGASEEESVAVLLSPELRAAMDAADDRPHALQSRPYPVDAERTEAGFSSWYELFPRSMGPLPEPGERPRHGTFADVIEHLPRIRDMGFDTLYFPPIHPIGRKNRKGPNNSLTPGPEDPGSPYATGSEEGGHDAIHPELGTFEEFDRMVAAAHEHGLEIALDFAIQAAPDHPWLTEHPGWFAWRPDGSMKYAENPPKKYQDIVNVDFYGPDAVPGLWEALRDVILLWVSHGVKTFRVDNPHTKPLPFWEWMIGEVRAQHPEVIFLSEAFTRPTMMYRLAKVGFSQSYTYFTWRDTKHELTEYIIELTTEAPSNFYRPHFFVNTPDINPHFLQHGGRPAHRIRAVLAATLSGLWGVFSGFELCDATPLGPGKEEYLDSEKYEIRPRDWQAPGNIIADITLLNRLRRAHPALQTHLGTRFYVAHDDNMIWYGKPGYASDGSLRDMIMVMVNMDPHAAHGCDFEVPLWEFGFDDNGAVSVEDLAHGYRFDWHGKVQHITLATDEPYRIWRLTRPGAA